jgi:2,3-bisphosphoglycerate-dependent phosphoglycerate mutase
MKAATTSSLVEEATLVLVRHGESEGNRDNQFTGSRDVDLSERGVAEAKAVGVSLVERGFRFRRVFSSALQRARRSAEIIIELQATNLPIETDAALNERDYGQLAGVNKDVARSRWGEERVRVWRRSYAVAPPGGESLRDTAARVLPCYIKKILPAAMGTGSVLVVAHGNSLRALIMTLDAVAPLAVPDLEIATGEAVIYRFNADTTIADRSSFRVIAAADLPPSLAP